MPLKINRPGHLGTIFENEDPEAMIAETTYVYTDILGPPPLSPRIFLPQKMTKKIPPDPLLNCSEKSHLILVQNHCDKDEGSKWGLKRDKVPEYGTVTVRRKGIPAD